MSNYNQEKYIKKAIDSVLMQKVNFKYKLIITDDNSEKDNSVQVIKDYTKKYPEIIQPLFNKDNGGYLKNILRANALTKTPYFCLLDADDFYISENFLQRAYDFLETNKEYVIYYENVNCLYEDGSEKAFISPEKENGSYDINDYINDKIPIVQTTGQFYRNVIFSKGIPEIMSNAVGTNSERSFEGDFDRFIMHLKYGKAYFNNRICGVYRILSSGIWSKLSECTKELIQLQCYYDYNRYFENKYSDFFINKMYNECHKIIKSFEALVVLDFTEQQLKQFYMLYCFLVERKNSIKTPKEEKKHIRLKKRIKDKIKKVLYRFSDKND
jgi:glycosyltransferase involved in cell wall biosynthesis